jgi:hypothetical protein
MHRQGRGLTAPFVFLMGEPVFLFSPVDTLVTTVMNSRVSPSGYAAVVPECNP